MSPPVPMRVVLGPADLPAEGEIRAVEITPALRVLVSRVGGRLHAMDDVCNHGGCRLSFGTVEGTQVTCPCHYMSFDLRDGRLLSTPRLAKDQRTFEVAEEGGEVVVLVPQRS